MPRVLMKRSEVIHLEGGSSITYLSGLIYNVDDELAGRWQKAGIAVDPDAPPEPPSPPPTPAPKKRGGS